MILQLSQPTMKNISLSEEQNAAVTADGQRVVIVASPGSGKSRCLVERAKRCANPGNVCVLSFTNSAADELRERLAADGCDPHRFRWLGTLHSFALTEMSRFGALPAILGDAEKDEAIDAVMKRLGAMARNMSKKEAWGYAMDPPPFGAGASVGKAIRAFFRSNGSTHIDFVLGDFLARCGEVAVPDELMIDETQDSGELDFAIYNAFAARGSRLWLVADPRQSIYGFRGARPDIMLAETRKPETQVFQLRTNYRSYPEICYAGTCLGRAMIGMEHLDAEIIPDDKEGCGDVVFEKFDSCEEEILCIAENWFNGTIEQGEKPPSFAVLCRFNDQVRSTAAILRAKGITLAASTDRELGTETVAWVPKLAAEADVWEVERMIDNDWNQVMTRLGVPFDDQKKLLPRLMRCHCAADVAGLADDEADVPECQCWVGTVHSVKGREFDHVWITGCDSATYHSGDQETLRLLFVGATRPRYSLTLSWARSRIQPGSMKRITVEPTEFLKLI